MELIDAKVIEDYKLILVFSDNSVKLFDINPYWDKITFKELKNDTLFEEIKVSSDSIYWGNGVSICIEVLHKDSVNCTYSFIKELFKGAKSKKEQDYYINLCNIILRKNQSILINEL